MISVWRNSPVLTPSLSQAALKIKNVFPSGRQALSYCLKHANLSRKDKVAIPEWSSHCVISAVGKIATPIPISEVIKFDINVSAVLIYDQWGWPVFDNCRSDLGERFKDTVIIHDAVDTVDIFENNKAHYRGLENVYTIFSLSKILGLEGGAIANFNGQHLTHIKENKDIYTLIQKIDTIDLKSTYHVDFIKNFKKNDVSFLSNKVTHWIKTNSLFKAINLEKSSRQKNINIIADHGLTNSWPKWMKDSLSKECAPAIIPLLKGVDTDILLKLQDELIKKFSMQSEIYNFDWNGNVIKSDYKKCIAIPVHGEVTNIDAIADMISLVRA